MILHSGSNVEVHVPYKYFYVEQEDSIVDANNNNNANANVSHGNGVDNQVQDTLAVPATMTTEQTKSNADQSGNKPSSSDNKDNAQQQVVDKVDNRKNEIEKHGEHTKQEPKNEVPKSSGSEGKNTGENDHKGAKSTQASHSHKEPHEPIKPQHNKPHENPSAYANAYPDNTSQYDKPRSYLEAASSYASNLWNRKEKCKYCLASFDNVEELQIHLVTAHEQQLMNSYSNASGMLSFKFLTLLGKEESQKPPPFTPFCFDVVPAISGPLVPYNIGFNRGIQVL